MLFPKPWAFWMSLDCMFNREYPAFWCGVSAFVFCPPVLVLFIDFHIEWCYRCWCLRKCVACIGSKYDHVFESCQGVEQSCCWLFDAAGMCMRKCDCLAVSSTSVACSPCFLFVTVFIQICPNKWKDCNICFEALEK